MPLKCSTIFLFIAVKPQKKQIFYKVVILLFLILEK